MNGGADRVSPWAPLRHPLFRAIWLATVASNIGTWMQSVGAAWLMTSLTLSPVMIAMVQAATSLPVFLLGLPAGALADIVDRRRLLIASECWMLATAAILSALTFAGSMPPALIVVLTFVLGLGSALSGPGFQALVTELVPRAELSAAVSLSGVAVNVARAVGPALGGLVLAWAGAAFTFLLNAVSFLGVIAVLFQWHPVEREEVLPAERFLGAMRSGLRYMAHAPELQAVLVRTAGFILPASAIWALLPLLVHNQMSLGPTAYGVLLGSLGTGALAGATLLPRIRQRISLDKMVNLASLVFGGAMLVAGLTASFAVMILAMLAGGVGWIVVLVSLSVATRMVVPGWVQSRALALYLLMFQGGTAVGSLLWGAVAGRAGTSAALIAAGIGLFLSLALALRYSLNAGEALDLTPAPIRNVPSTAADFYANAGLALVTVEYQIDPERADEFAAEMVHLQRVRRRDGAVQWGLFADIEKPGTYMEEFLVESWLEHLRQHERATAADRRIQERVTSMHTGAAPPRVTHYIAAGRRAGR